VICFIGQNHGVASDVLLMLESPRDRTGEIDRRPDTRRIGAEAAGDPFKVRRPPMADVLP